MVGQGKLNIGFFFLAGNSTSLAGGRKLRRKIGSFTPGCKRSHVCRSQGVSVMSVDSRKLPLSAIPPCHLGPPRLRLSISSQAVLTAPLECSLCPYQRSLLSFRMRSISSMPSRTSSSLHLMVTVSCSLTLQICLIIALSFRCR